MKRPWRPNAERDILTNQLLAYSIFLALLAVPISVSAQETRCEDNCYTAETSFAMAKSEAFVRAECGRKTDADGDKVNRRFIKEPGKPIYCLDILDSTLPKRVVDDGNHAYTAYCSTLVFYPGKPSDTPKLVKGWNPKQACVSYWLELNYLKGSLKTKLH